MSDIDSDAQERAEVLDETNLTEDGEESANFDEIEDVIDLTSAKGDEDEDEFDEDEIDDDDLEDDADDYRLIAEEDVDLDDLADDLEAEGDSAHPRIGTVDSTDGFPDPDEAALDGS